MNLLFLFSGTLRPHAAQEEQSSGNRTTNSSWPSGRTLCSICTYVLKHSRMAPLPKGCDKTNRGH